MDPALNPLAQGAATIKMRPDQATLLSQDIGRFMYMAPEVNDKGIPVAEGYAILPMESVINYSSQIDAVLALPALTSVKSQSTASVVMEVDRVGAILTTGYPRTEVDSWPTKDASAQAVLANKATPEQAQILQVEADKTGQTVEDVATKVSANSDAFKRIVGTLTGIRRNADVAIAAATTEAAAIAAANDARIQIKAIEEEILAALSPEERATHNARRGRRTP